MLNITDTINN